MLNKTIIQKYASILLGYIIIVCSFTIVIAVIYAAFAFTFLKFNPLDWSANARSLFAYVFILLLIVWVGFISSVIYRKC